MQEEETGVGDKRVLVQTLNQPPPHQWPLCFPSSGSHTAVGGAPTDTYYPMAVASSTMGACPPPPPPCPYSLGGTPSYFLRSLKLKYLPSKMKAHRGSPAPNLHTSDFPTWAPGKIVGGEQTDCLVDTGAAYSVLKLIHSCSFT